VPTEHSKAAAVKAVAMARAGEVEALMKGSLHTDELLHAVVDQDHGLRTGRRMSHVFALDVPRYARALFITDAAMNVHPTLAEKADIVQNAIDLTHALGIAMPHVAILSVGTSEAMQLAGLLALSDPPRSDAASCIDELRRLGVEVVIVTGDAPATAGVIAHAVGVTGAIYPPGPIRDDLRPEQFAVFAGVLPEDKFRLVKAFQRAGHVGDVRGRRERCARAATSAIRHCGVHGHRRGQVGGGHRAHRTRPGGHRRVRLRGPRNPSFTRFARCFF
jgi:Phosphate acetyl/butaryl transferase/haloacid dehalogenase-like hydrolase